MLTLRLRSAGDLDEQIRQLQKERQAESERRLADGSTAVRVRC